MSTPQSVAALDFHPAAPLHPSPRDWRDHFVYFLLVDRFDDNHRGTPRYSRTRTPLGRDPAQGRVFQGGNLKGITRRLDYIQGLGCNTVWLSPIFKNRQDDPGSYHGYGIQDFLGVDPRFGTLADLCKLTSDAHRRGMYVILDIVLNHTGDVWSYPGDHPYYYAYGQQFPFAAWRSAHDPFGPDDALWPRELQDPENFKRQGQIRNWWDNTEARDGDFLSLKELNLSRPLVLDTLIKIYKYWLCTADIDGFRIDTVKHMEHSATAIFCNALREYARRVGKDNFFMFGEIVADDDTIQRYLGRNARIEGTNERFPSLDAALDFPLYFMLEDVIKGFTPPAALRHRYDGFRDHYADHGQAGEYFVTFVDNHDQMSRPYRRFMHANPHPQQAVLAMAYLLTAPGVPCIYYGTEQAFDGGGNNDSFVRECMFGGQWGAFDTTGAHCFNTRHSVYQQIAALAQVRQQQPALRYGRLYFREISGNGQDFGHPIDGHCSLAYSRILDSDEVLVVLNLDGQARNDAITVDRHLSGPGRVMRDLLRPDYAATVVETHGRAHVRVELPAHGIAVLKVG